MTIKEALSLLAKHDIHLSHEAIRKWCLRHGVGVRRAGQWDIDPGRLAEHVLMTVEELTGETDQ